MLFSPLQCWYLCFPCYLYRSPVCNYLLLRPLMSLVCFVHQFRPFLNCVANFLLSVFHWTPLLSMLLFLCSLSMLSFLFCLSPPVVAGSQCPGAQRSIGFCNSLLWKFRSKSNVRPRLKHIASNPNGSASNSQSCTFFSSSAGTILAMHNGAVVEYGWQQRKNGWVRTWTALCGLRIIGYLRWLQDCRVPAGNLSTSQRGVKILKQVLETSRCY